MAGYQGSFVPGSLWIYSVMDAIIDGKCFFLSYDGTVKVIGFKPLSEFNLSSRKLGFIRDWPTLFIIQDLHPSGKRVRREEMNTMGGLYDKFWKRGHFFSDFEKMHNYWYGRAINNEKMLKKMNKLLEHHLEMFI